MSEKAHPVIHSDAPLCRCCEEALAACVYGSFLVDVDLPGPVCIDCGNLLASAGTMLDAVRGIKGCAALGPDSGKGVLS